MDEVFNCIADFGYDKKRGVPALSKLLRKKGIPVCDDCFCAHMFHIKGRIDTAKEFGRKE